MVATRKAQAAPLPPTSRSNSSQPLPKASAAAKSQPLQPPLLHAQQPAQRQPSPGKKQQKLSSKEKERRRASQTPKHPSFFHRIISFILILLTFHTLTTCPTDASLSSPVCRSLASYRHNVVEPYILPPVFAILNFPSVRPYVDSAQVTLSPHIQTIERVERLLRPYSQRAGHYLNQASAKTYNAVLVPTYELYILPYLRSYVFPHYEAHVQPYVRQVTPYISYATAKVHYVWVTAKPLVVNVYVHVKPHVIRAWISTRPYLCAAWREAKLQGAKGVIKFVDLRKEFVDPHIRRIWEKVVEPSGQPAITSISRTQQTSTRSLIQETTILESETTAAPVSSGSHISVVSQPVSQTPQSQKAEADRSAASVVEESAGAQQSGPEESLVEEIRGRGSSIIPGAVAQHTTQTADSDDELDELLRDIGMSDVEEREPEEEPAPPLPRQTESEEEKKARVTAQRAEIVGRHTTWQAKIDDAAEQGLRKFRAVLGMIRWDAVDELERREGRILVGQEDSEGKKFREEMGMDDDKEKLKGWVNGEKALQGEAERFIRALDSYVKKVARKISYALNDAGGNELADSVVQLKKEDSGKWYEVAEKVEEKFLEKMRNAQSEVHHWYMSQREKEVQEILRLENEVKNIASLAQSDIGMDYAWLDDVTHWDWKNYHYLMTSAHNFAHELRGIQNGTHVDAAPDPLVQALNTLQHDLDEIVNGFQQRVRKIRAEADNVFLIHSKPATGADDETQTQSDETQNSDKVSILPTDPQDGSQERSDDGLKEAGRIVLGRGQEEVEQAFQRAAAGREEL